jgi:hypothetical protein
MTWRFYYDSIILDTEAFIDSVIFSPAGPFSPGETVHFAVYTTEAGGSAGISIGAGITDIGLFDNGQRGDVTVDDGIYELDYNIPPAFDFEDQIVYGDFADRAGNNAATVQANSRLSVRRPPDAVNIFSIIAPQGYHDRLDLGWEQATVQDFAQYRVYRGTSPGVDSTDLLAASIISISGTSLTDTGLVENTTYYYVVYVVDVTGLWSGSNEVSATTGIDMPPEAVTLYPVIIEPDYYQEIEIEWSQSPDDDFESYRLYRWREDIGRSDSLLAAFVANRQSTSFTDHPPFDTAANMTDFWYVVHVYDNAGYSTASDSIRVHLVDAIPPTVSGSVSSSDSSLVMTWSQPDIPDFGSYRLLRDTDSNPAGAITVFVSPNSTTITYDDESTIEGQTYYYWLDIYDIRDNKSQTNLGSGAW